LIAIKAIRCFENLGMQQFFTSQKKIPSVLANSTRKYQKHLKNGRPTLVPHFGKFYNILAKHSRKVKYLHMGSTLADQSLAKIVDWSGGSRI
jgi:hypothetical protein